MESINSYWIFQANPKYYDLRGALKSLNRLQWGVLRYKDKIVKDDIAFLWEAGHDAGIIAQAKIEDAPKYLPELEEEKPFMRKQEKFDEMKLQVPVDIQYVLPYPLSKSVLKLHPILKDMQILRFAQGTNFPLTQAQGTTLLAEIQSHLSGENKITDYYYPSKNDFMAAYRKITLLGQELPLDDILNRMEQDIKAMGHVLRGGWRSIIEEEIRAWSKDNST